MADFSGETMERLQKISDGHAELLAGFIDTGTTFWMWNAFFHIHEAAKHQAWLAIEIDPDDDEEKGEAARMILEATWIICGRLVKGQLLPSMGKWIAFVLDRVDRASSRDDGEELKTQIACLQGDIYWVVLACEFIGTNWRDICDIDRPGSLAEFVMRSVVSGEEASNQLVRAAVEKAIQKIAARNN